LASLAALGSALQEIRKIHFKVTVL
jgi:hypothetical protein